MAEVNAAVAEALGAAVVAGVTGSLGVVLGGATVLAVARVKHSFFSWDHLAGARHFATRAGAIEKNAVQTEDTRSELRANVSGAVLLSAAFLEASINELFLEANDPGSTNTTLKGLNDSQIGTLGKRWAEVERHGILEKYQDAFVACGKDRFEAGGKFFQDTEALVKIRDSLMHSKPEWSDEENKHKELERLLKNRFQPNALVPEGSLWFPHLCLGAGCAQWAVDQAIGFSKKFCGRMGIPDRLPVIQQ